MTDWTPEDAERVSRQTSAALEYLMGFDRQGRSYTIPGQAGGSDKLADELVGIFCKALHLQKLPPAVHKSWCKQMRSIVDTWQATDDEARAALTALMDDENEEYNWKAYSSPFQKGFVDDYGLYLGRAISGESVTGQRGGWYSQYQEHIRR